MALQRTGVCHGREEIRPLLYPNDRGDRGPCDGSAGVKSERSRSVAAHELTRMERSEGHTKIKPPEGGWTRTTKQNPNKFYLNACSHAAQNAGEPRQESYMPSRCVSSAVYNDFSDGRYVEAIARRIRMIRPLVHRESFRSFSNGAADAIRTTPWMACGPKCVVASPPKTRVMLEFGIEYGASSPPVTQTCSVDEGGFVSKGALSP